MHAYPSRLPIVTTSAEADVQPYRAIANHVLNQIAGGELKPGDKLPSRAELAAEHGVSPMTVSSAVRLLRQRGVVITRQGTGVFVAQAALLNAVRAVASAAEIAEFRTTVTEAIRQVDTSARQVSAVAAAVAAEHAAVRAQLSSILDRLDRLA